MSLDGVQTKADRNVKTKVASRDICEPTDMHPAHLSGCSQMLHLGSWQIRKLPHRIRPASIVTYGERPFVHGCLEGLFDYSYVLR